MENNPYQAPTSDLHTAGNQQPLQYVGFWIRVAASLIDSILLILITLPLLYILMGASAFDPEAGPGAGGVVAMFINYLLPIIAVITFWVLKSATPGKMLFQATIVDAKTGNKPSIGQFIGRYFAYIPSTLIFGLGCFWIIWDKRKQGWHDKLAGTVVVRPCSDPAKQITFE